MKRIGLSVVLMIGLLFSVSAVTFAAGPYKVDFVGQGVELEQETLEDGQKVSVELQVYTDTGVDRFDAAAILLVGALIYVPVLRKKKKTKASTLKARTGKWCQSKALPAGRRTRSTLPLPSCKACLTS